VRDVSGSDQAEAEAAQPEARDGASRRRFLALAGPGALAVLVSACGSSSDPQTADPEARKAFAPRGGQDQDIVNFALTLEYLESDFYSQVNQQGIFSGPAGDLFKMIEENEREHVAALQKLSKDLFTDGKVVEKPATHFPLEGSPASVLRLAATFENVGAAAYLGQVDVIENRDVMAAALSIHTVEARHAAKLNRLVDQPFTPDGAFASPMSMQDVLSAISPYVV
jgi:rubrerythrin